jgi:hypothetical protein
MKCLCPLHSGNSSQDFQGERRQTKKMGQPWIYILLVGQGGILLTDELLGDGVMGLLGLQVLSMAEMCSRQTRTRMVKIWNQGRNWPGD